MSNPDLLLYLVHGLFWATFGIAGFFLKEKASALPASRAPTVTAATTAPYSRTVLAVHFVAFGVMYFGLGNAILSHQVPIWFPGQRLVGTVVILVGAGFMSWARIWFHSWRFRAKLDTGHQLATGGPFHWLRHPIYLGLNLLAIGSAVWVPTLFTWIAAGLMMLGSDLRGRAEERALLQAFGPPYADYLGRTKRFVPGIY